MSADAAPEWARRSCSAEFRTAEALLEAAAQVREKGYKDLDTHTPYPLHGGDEALGLGRSTDPDHRSGGAIAGMFIGYRMMVLYERVDFPLNVGNRPPQARRRTSPSPSS